MDICKHIYDYLMEYNTPVVVPELGSFTIFNVPSEIKDGKVIPPFKTVKLDSENTVDDSVITGYIARKENITVEQAAKGIHEFYCQNFLNKITTAKSIVFEKFGTFSLDAHHNIVFEPDPDFFKVHYGLDDINIPEKTQFETADFSAMPEPEPVLTSEPFQTPWEPPRPEPVFASEPGQKPSEPLFTKTQSSNDAGNNPRFRENTTRKERPQFEKKQQTAPPPQKPKPAPVPKKPKQKTKSNSNLWIIWVLLAAVGLACAGYYYYPKIYPILFSPSTTIVTFDDAEQESEYDDTDEPDEGFDAEFEQTDDAADKIAQSLDDAADKKNALNPEGTRPTEATTTQTSSTPEVRTPSTPTSTSSSTSSSSSSTTTTSSSTSSTSSTSTVQRSTATQSQANVGSGRYALIISSHSTRSSAERFVARMKAEGLECEIIDAGNQRFRISVASFDTLAEATRQANQMKSRPYCQDVWVARR